MLPVKLILFISILSFSKLNAQFFELGIKTGISNYQSDIKSLIFESESQNLELTLQNIESGYHFGLFTRFNIFLFYIEPSLLFNAYNSNYSLSDFSDGTILSNIKNESFKEINMPILIGYKMGILRLTIGPEMTFNIDNTSDLIAFSEYEARFNIASWSYILGLGLDIWRFRIQLHFDQNLSNFGDHITINNQNFNFGTKPSRLKLNIGIKF